MGYFTDVARKRATCMITLCNDISRGKSFTRSAWIDVIMQWKGTLGGPVNVRCIMAFTRAEYFTSRSASPIQQSQTSWFNRARQNISNSSYFYRTNKSFNKFVLASVNKGSRWIFTASRVSKSSLADCSDSVALHFLILPIL